MIIGGFAQRAGLRYALDRVSAGLSRANRGWADIDVVAWLYTCVSDDREAARRAVSRMVMASVITSRTILDQLGIVLPDELADRVASGRWTYAEDEMLAAARLLPEEVIEAFAVYGTAKECVRRLTGDPRLRGSAARLRGPTRRGHDLGRGRHADRV